MKIETKYNTDEQVYVFNGKHVVRGKIIGIRCEYGQGENYHDYYSVQVTYKVKIDYGFINKTFEFNEDLVSKERDVFKSFLINKHEDKIKQLEKEIEDEQIFIDRLQNC